MPAPKKYTLGELVTVDAVFRQAGVPTDPTAVELVVAKPGDDDTSYRWPDPPGPLGPIVHDSAGLFHADLLTDQKGLWAYRFVASGSGATAAEGEFYVQSKVTDAIDLLIGAEDYEAIRQLLGVTEYDVGDEVIESPTYGQQAELEVKNRVSDWEDRVADADDYMRLRLATGYWTASLIAGTYAQGGMIGLAHDGRLADRNWHEEAGRLRAVAERWIGELTKDDVGLYDVPMVAKAGPSRRRRVAPGGPRPAPSWAYGYPVVWGGWTPEYDD